MMFEAMAFKVCTIYIKLSTSNFKLKKALSSCDSAFFCSLERLFLNHRVEIQPLRPVGPRTTNHEPLAMNH